MEAQATTYTMAVKSTSVRPVNHKIIESIQMKKTIITLSLASLFSTTSIASDVISPIKKNAHTSIQGTVVIPDRPSPDYGNTPDWGAPDAPIDRPHPVDPGYGKPTTPDRPTPDFGETPDWGAPDTPVERPHPVDPGYGKPTTPDRPTPDFGDTPNWGAPDDPVDRPEPVDPSFGLPAKPVQPGPVAPTVTDSERITNLETEFNRMADRVNEQAEQIDGIRAGLHAVTNARPFVTSGEFAIGAGVGFSGSKEALALGGAYGINENWSMSGTFHYEASGKYSSSDVAGGVGLQYNFK